MILTIKDPEVFDAIVEGRKRFEGRAWKEDYASLNKGDIILFILEGSAEIAVTTVTDLRPFDTVKDMVSALWRELIPWAGSKEEVERYYANFYDLGAPALAIGIKPIKKEVLDGRALRKWLGTALPPLRVAVAVDGNALFEGHFGDAPHFYIYECTQEECVLVEKRENRARYIEEEHEEHHGDPRKFRVVLELLRDTDVWCAFRMGPNYVRIVKETDKIPFLAGTRDLERALRRLRGKYVELALKRVCKWR